MLHGSEASTTVAGECADKEWLSRVCCEANLTANEHLRDFILGPLMVLFAFIFVFQYRLCYGRSLTLYTFGMCLVVVQIYYSDVFFYQGTVKVRNFKSDHPFVKSLVFMLLEGVVGAAVSWRTRGNRCHCSFRTLYPALDTVDTDYITNRYQDITKPFVPAVICFAAQCGLMMYFVVGLDLAKDAASIQEVSFVMWLVAALIMTLANYSDVGVWYNRRFWMRLINKDDYYDQRLAWKYQFLGVPMEWIARRCMDFIVNSVCRIVLLGTAPILVCDPDGMTFIRDSMAIVLITKLDYVEMRPMEVLIEPPAEPIVDLCAYDPASESDQ